MLLCSCTRVRELPHLQQRQVLQAIQLLQPACMHTQQRPGKNQAC